MRKVFLTLPTVRCVKRSAPLCVRRVSAGITPSDVVVVEGMRDASCYYSTTAAAAVGFGRALLSSVIIFLDGRRKKKYHNDKITIPPSGGGVGCAQDRPRWEGNTCYVLQ